MRDVPSPTSYEQHARLGALRQQAAAQMAEAQALHMAALTLVAENAKLRDEARTCSEWDTRIVERIGSEAQARSRDVPRSGGARRA